MQSNERFEVIEKLGAGGMGVVYRVFDAKQGCEVALKRASKPSADALYRLKREFRTRAGLAHPNLVHLYELIADGDHLAFTMELLEGQSFLRWVRDVALFEPRPTLDGATIVSREDPAPHQATDSDDADTVASGRAEPSEEEMKTHVLDHATAPVSPSTRTVVGGGPDELSSESSSAASPRPRSRLEPAPLFNMEHEERTRSAIVGLLRGVNALHESGQIHRDIKSSNVLVEPGGRVVILDFGLTGALHTHDTHSATVDLAGTPAYMAPELISGTASVATDMYAVGVLLFEAMLDRPPFTGSLLETLQAKTKRASPDPRSLNPSLPEDLAELACDLLERDPAKRPSAREALDRVSPRDRSSASGTSAAVVPFEGRGSELTFLETICEQLPTALGPSMCRVIGESGLGKTRLMRHFLESNKGAHLVFSSACNRNESIPFQGIDAIVEKLSRYLSGLSPSARAAVLPRRLFALKRLFPALSQVPEIAAAKTPRKLSGPLVDPKEFRQLGFAALRDLFGRVAAGRPTVLWIDDWQWCDPDSLFLLQELLSAEDAPELMVAASYRSEDRSSSTAISTWEGLRPQQGRHDELTLGALDADETRRLISQLAPQAKTSLVDSAVERARGNPFMAVELGRFLASQGETEAPLPENVFSQLIDRRLSWLDADAKSLVEVVAVANGPVPANVALEAAGFTGQSQLSVRRLCDGQLLRETSSERAELTTYHDSLRETVVASMDAEHLQATHRTLAEALEANTPEAYEALFVHWAGAGETQRAIDIGLAAADRASESLAFGLAARLYERTLKLVPEAERSTDLLRSYASALANCGRGLEAAESFLLAAERCDERSERLLLHRQGAEQLIKAGYASRGWGELKIVLRELDIPVPGSQISCLLGSAWRRVRFLVSRKPSANAISDQHSLSASELNELETLWTASTSLSMLNHTLSDNFRTRHLARVLKDGSRSMIARVLSYEVAMETHIGGSFLRKNADKLLQRVEELVALTEDPYDEAWRQLAIVNYWFTESNWMACVQAAQQAEEIFEQECVGAAWERSTVKHFRHLAQANLGELDALGRALGQGLSRAEANADVSDALNHLCPEPVLAWIAKGQGEWALGKIEALHAQLEQPVAEWPDNIYRASDAHRMTAKVLIAYSQGDFLSGYRLMTEQWQPLKKSFILGLQHGRMCYPFMRALGALGLLTHPAASDSQPEELLALVSKTRASLTKDPRPMSQALALHLGAGLAVLAGDQPQAIDLLREVQTICDEQYLGLLGQSARRGLLALDVPDRKALSSEIDRWLGEQKVSDPAALFRVHLPFLEISG